MAVPSVDVEQILRVLSTLLSPDQAVELAT